MAGIIIPIIEKRIFEYSYLTNGSSQDVVLHPAIDVEAWYRVKIVVLRHQCDTQSGNFTFSLWHSFPCEDDRQEFVSSSSWLVTSGITSGSGDNLQYSSTGTDPHGHLKMILTANQPTTTGHRLYGEFSAYLVVRDG